MNQLKQIKDLFKQCRKQGINLDRPKEFLIPATIMIIDKNNDGDISNDELRLVLANRFLQCKYS